MKRIEAIIRPENLAPLRQQLETLSYPGMTVIQVEGHGRQKGVSRQWRGMEYRTYFLPKLKVEIVAPDKAVRKILDAIVDTCHSGSVGDGKIFLSDVRDAIRIRTREKGDKALL